MTERPTPVDVVVVGLGAAGALTAHVLASAGVRVVAFEAGGDGPDPGGAASLARGTAPDADGSAPHPEPPTVRDHAGAAAAPDPAGAAAGTGRGIGGSKARSAGQSFRLGTDAMRLRSAAEAELGRGALAPDVTLADWPLTAEDLAPYHRRVEQLFGVAGAPGGAPALPGTRWTTLMGDAARGLGWAPFAAPVALVTPGRPGDGPPGLAGAALLRPAVAGGALAVHTGARVLGVTLDADGAADGVDVLRAGRTVHQPARAVVLAASVLGNVRLLLLSRPAAQPDGLGNATGQLGRHYATHAVTTVHGLFPGRDLGRAQGPPGQAVVTAAFDRPTLPGGIVGGSVLQAAMGVPADATLAALDVGRREAGSVGSVWAQPEQLPRERHVLDLDPDHRDDLGRPLLRVTHGLAPDDRARAAFLKDRMETWLTEAGATVTVRSPARPASLGTHRYGGTRMGMDPACSVVASDGTVHGVPGLLVVGASTFPSTGGRGPTQTVEALAWRSAELLLRRLGR